MFITTLTWFLLQTAEAKEIPVIPIEQIIQTLPVESTSTEAIKEKIKYYAEKYAVNPVVMDRTVKCESQYSTSIQSKALYTKDHPEWGVKKGDQELSFGLSQIHLPAHPTIKKEQAIDPDFALDFLASNLAKGKGNLWSCYKLLNF